MLLGGGGMRPSIVFALLACACGDNTEPPSPPPPDPGLPDGVDPFAGPDVEGSADLEPLWDLVGGARFVGLGESVHTSGGFYALKRRLIRVLIEERGFRTFAMETPRLQTGALVAYLASGDCDTPTDAKILDKSIFPVFADDNTAALMRFVCHWNVDHPEDPVTFFGFDMQQPVEDRGALVRFLDTHAAPDAPQLREAVASCVADNRFEPQTQEAYDSCVAGLAVVDAYLADHEAELVAAAGERDFRIGRLAFTSWRAFQDELFFMERDIDRSYEARDNEMAHVFEELVALDAKPDAGVVIWAHDFHLSAAQMPVTRPVTTMGTRLREIHGADYAPIAITAKLTEINWPGVGNGPTAIGMDPESVEARLAKLGEAALIVDTRSEAIAARPIPEGFYDLPHPVREHWDGILYLDHSPPMRSVFWGAGRVAPIERFAPITGPAAR